MARRSSKRPIIRDVSSTEEAATVARAYLDSMPTEHAGRLSGLADTATVETLLRGFRSGLKVADCCEAAGISTRTYQRWVERAEAEPDGAHGAFVAALKRARAHGKLRRLEKIERHGDREWTALAWINERTDPEQFGKRHEDASVPRVVVQIGVQASDVQVRLSDPEVPQK